MVNIEERINKTIDKIKVINYQEEIIPTESNFIKFKKGIYQLNNGEKIDRESVIKNVGSGNAASIFAVTKEGKILIVIHPRVILPTKTKVSIELPAGYIEKNENAKEAAIRELEEETGYTTNNIKKIDSYYPSLGVSGERIDLFLALNCQKTTSQHLDKDEFLYYEEVTIEEFKYLLDNNYIIGANEKIGYYHYMDYLRKE